MKGMSGDDKESPGMRRDTLAGRLPVRGDSLLGASPKGPPGSGSSRERESPTNRVGEDPLDWSR